MEELNWHNCYSDNLKGIICDEAFCHPAKFSYGLIARIYSHLLERGWLQEGDLVADPFAGVGIGGIVAAANGLRWIGVELEEKFCKLAEDSFSLHGEHWEMMGKPYPVILQGDSRNFSSIIREAVDSIITSPPYSRSLDDGHPSNTRTDGTLFSYGFDSDGQIGAMKEGNLEEVVDSIITSPPFGRDIEPHRARPMEEWRGTEKWGGPHSVVRAQGYGHSEGQLGGMPEGDHAEVVSGIITSPPYATSATGHKPSTGFSSTEARIERLKAAGYNAEAMLTPGRRAHGNLGEMEHYSDNPTNMGNLPEGSHEEVVEAIVTSPPWEKTSHERTFHSDEELEAFAKQQWVYREGGRSLEATKAFLQKDWQGYSETEGQIGQEESETYWASCAQVYSECWKTLRIGGILCVVVKAFVRNKQIVDLPSQTLELLQAIGFEPLERIRAWMVSPATQKSLMPEIKEDYQKSRKSFFRRLAESKGSPHVDFEEVLIVQKLGRRSND